MKVKLKYMLPEDQNEYDVTVQAPKLQAFIFELNQQLKSWQKDEHGFKDADEAIDKIREYFHTLVDAHNIDLDL